MGTAMKQHFKRYTCYCHAFISSIPL